MIGSHWIKSWSATHKVVALSSGEAELVAVVKTSTELIGLMSMYSDWKRHYGAKVFADSTAALGVVHRRGSGKLRHVRVGMLWVQGKREEYAKVGGLDNPADLMTKHLSSDLMKSHLKRLSVEVGGGRAEESLQLSSLKKRRRRKRQEE